MVHLSIRWADPMQLTIHRCLILVEHHQNVVDLFAGWECLCYKWLGPRYCSPLALFGKKYWKHVVAVTIICIVRRTMAKCHLVDLQLWAATAWEETWLATRTTTGSKGHSPSSNIIVIVINVSQEPPLLLLLM